MSIDTAQRSRWPSWPTSSLTRSLWVHSTASTSSRVGPGGERFDVRAVVAVMVGELAEGGHAAAALVERVAETGRVAQPTESRHRPVAQRRRAAAVARRGPAGIAASGSLRAKGHPARSAAPGDGCPPVAAARACRHAPARSRRPGPIRPAAPGACPGERRVRSRTAPGRRATRRPGPGRSADAGRRRRARRAARRILRRPPGRPRRDPGSASVARRAGSAAAPTPRRSARRLSPRSRGSPPRRERLGCGTTGRSSGPWATCRCRPRRDCPR